MRFVNDEARSYLARMRDPVDIIQISLIDTWAATASGAFVLTENSLYTLEAWTNFLNRLTPRGVLSVSRWYYADRPGEVYRSAVLAATTLQKRGVKRPGDHFVIVRARPTPTKDAPDGIGTILVSPEPFSAADLDTLDEVAARLRFEVVQSPRISRDETFAAIADGRQLTALLAGYPLDISAPTDDSPFFFHMLRIRDVFNLQRWRDQGIVSFNMKAVGVLGVLLATVTLMTAACILLPLVRTRRTVNLQGAAPHLVYFAAIGFGFMLVEISQLQRLTIFLGHPAYSLSVVLFSLLVSSGAGSLSTGRVADAEAGRATRRRLLIDAGGARRLWHRHASHHAPLRRRGHAGAHPDRRRHPPASWLLPGDGVSTGDAPRPAAFAVNRALALGRQRRNVGVRVGPRRRHRHRGGDIGGLLGRHACLSGSPLLARLSTPNLQLPTPKGNRSNPTG